MIYKETADTLPLKLYLAEQIKSGELQSASHLGLDMYQLMEAAGHAVFDCVLARFANAKHIFVVAGCGNNGGDAYVVARLISQSAIPITVFSPQPSRILKGDAEIARQAYLSTGEQIMPVSSYHTFAEELAPELVIDGLIGTGFVGELRADYRELINNMNSTQCDIIAIDVPSGLNSDTGFVLNVAVLATYTVTFIGMKLGLATQDGPDHCGTLFFAGLGIEKTFEQLVKSSAEWIHSPAQVAIAKRPHNSHKGKFGHVVCLGGGAGMPGAIFLAAKSALRTGAGKVTVITHQDNVTLVNGLAPELMVYGSDGVLSPTLIEIVSHADVLVVGPGLSQTDWGISLFVQLLESQILMKVSSIIDADGLNLLAKHQSQALHNHHVGWTLTPHPLEAARLLNCSVREVSQNRKVAAQKIAEQFDATVVLKGCGSIVASHNECTVNASGNPGMSTAGMGDVLTGVIAGLIAQSNESEINLYDATKKAVFLHGLAGDKSAKNGEVGIIATDIIEYMPFALDICTM